MRGTRDSGRSEGADEGEADRDRDGSLAKPRGDGWDGFPVRGSYAQGVAWIVMTLARALHYAHRRQTFHRDVKPGNLLLTLQSGPQLLDFNLAESPHSANQAQSALHGGTLPYMAPEQISAFLDPQLWSAVGARADVYALGLVLREMLTGQTPELPDPGLPPARALRSVLDRRAFLDPGVRQFNPAIPRSLEAIVAKCLALSPDDRYSDAKALERDLDRFLKHLPLEQSPKTASRERLGNWLVRNRRVLVATGCAVAVAFSTYFLWQTRRLGPPLGPKIESSAGFLAAVEAVNAGQIEPAISRLSALERTGPQSCLVEFYLSLAQNDGLAGSADADRSLRKALAAPDATETLIAWSKNHAEVVEYLVHFSDSRIRRADQIADEVDNGNAISDSVRDAAYRQPTYELARDTLRLAEKLDPRSARIQRLIARTERIFGEYESAYNRLSALINRRGSADQLDSQSLLGCSSLRVWVAFLWAERDLREGVSLDDGVHARLSEAKADLDVCDRVLKMAPIPDAKDQARSEYHALHDRLRTYLTSAEIELKSSHVPRAADDTRVAEKTLARLIQFIDSRKLGGTVPKTEDVAKRLANLKSLLNVEQAESNQNRPIEGAPDRRPPDVATSSGI